jgi:hypothetical protein
MKSYLAQNGERMMFRVTPVHLHRGRHGVVSDLKFHVSHTSASPIRHASKRARIQEPLHLLFLGGMAYCVHQP